MEYDGMTKKQFKEIEKFIEEEVPRNNNFLVIFIRKFRNF